MPARLIDSLATSGAMAEVFSDASVLQAMLDFEAALAGAEAELGIVPKTAASAIGNATQAAQFDIAKLTQETLRAVDAAAAGFVHWGATSQDVADTGLILLLTKAQPILVADLTRLEQAPLR